ncbi:MAG: hypothetical protein IKP21_03710 [Bacteroidales bacterium]|nr:hypothetical protein [Bacteroidales bacterium]
MKRLFPSVFILFFIAIGELFCAKTMQAQSIIYDANPNSEYSIIRNYKRDVDITYNIIAGESHSFNYIDRNNMTVYSAPVVGLFAVLDFVIYNDTVYFCGSGSGNYAVYGYFDINDVFFS